MLTFVSKSVSVFACVSLGWIANLLWFLFCGCCLCDVLLFCWLRPVCEEADL